MRRGGFAVGAGDADEPQPLGGTAAAAGRQKRQRLPGIRDKDLPGQAQIPLDNDGGGAPAQRIGGIFVAVVPLPTDTDENFIFDIPS